MEDIRRKYNLIVDLLKFISNKRRTSNIDDKTRTHMQTQSLTISFYEFSYF